MNIEWLSDRDGKHHERLYRYLCAQHALCSAQGFTGHATVVKDQMRWLLAFDKITEGASKNIEAEVRAELAQMKGAWKEHLSRAGEQRVIETTPS